MRPAYLPWMIWTWWCRSLEGIPGLISSMSVERWRKGTTGSRVCRTANSTKSPQTRIRHAGPISSTGHQKERGGCGTPCHCCPTLAHHPHFRPHTASMTTSNGRRCWCATASSGRPAKTNMLPRPAKPLKRGDADSEARSGAPPVVAAEGDVEAGNPSDAASVAGDDAAVEIRRSP